MSGVCHPLHSWSQKELDTIHTEVFMEWQCLLTHLLFTDSWNLSLILKVLIRHAGWWSLALYQALYFTWDQSGVVSDLTTLLYPSKLWFSLFWGHVAAILLPNSVLPPKNESGTVLISGGLSDSARCCGENSSFRNCSISHKDGCSGECMVATWNLVHTFNGLIHLTKLMQLWPPGYSEGCAELSRVFSLREALLFYIWQENDPPRNYGNGELTHEFPSSVILGLVSIFTQAEL